MRAEEYLTILTDQIRCKMERGAVHTALCIFSQAWRS